MESRVNKYLSAKKSSLVDLNPYNKFSCYNVSDWLFIEKLRDHFYKNNTFEAKGIDGEEYMKKWFVWVERLLNTVATWTKRKRKLGQLPEQDEPRENIDEVMASVPEAWSDSEVLPTVNAANVGYAGTGKSVLANNLLMFNKDMYISGPTNGTTEALDNSYMSQEYVGGKRYKMSTGNTLFKAMSLAFHTTRGENIIKDLGNNQRVSDAYEKFLEDLDSASTSEKKRAASRLLFQESIPAMVTMLRVIYTMKKTEVCQYTYKYILYGKYEPLLTFLQSPVGYVFQEHGNVNVRFNDILGEKPSDEPQFIRGIKECVVAIIAVNYNGITDKKKLPPSVNDNEDVSHILKNETGASMRRVLLNSTKVNTQQEYVEFVMRHVPENKKATYPPMCVLHNIVASEEDSRTPVYFKHLYALTDIMCRNFYRQPDAFITPSFYFSMGSDTQMKTIGCVGSPVTFMTSPVVSADTDNTLVGRSVFFRRAKDNLDPDVIKVRRMLPVMLENKMDLTEEAMASLNDQMEWPSLVNDPNHGDVGSVRLYMCHKDIRKINEEKQKNRKSGEDSLTLTDFIFVNSNMVTMEDGALERYGVITANNPYGVYTEGLSTEHGWTDCTKYLHALCSHKIPIYTDTSDGSKMAVGTIYEEFNKEELEALHKPRNPLAYDARREVEVAKYMEARNMEIFKRSFKEGLHEAGDENDDEDEDGGGEPDMIKKYIKEMTGKEEDERERNIMISMAANEGEQSKSRVDAMDATLKEVEKGGGCKRGKKRDNGAFVTTKLAVCGPTRKLLTREEHMRHRIYAKHILDYLGDGSSTAKSIFHAANASDQVALCKPAPEADMSVVFINPMSDSDKKMLYKTWDEKKHVEDNISGCITYIALKRERLVVEGTPVANIGGTNTELQVVAFNASLEEIMKNSTYNNDSFNAKLRLLILVEAIHRKRDELCLGNGVASTFEEKIAYEEDMMTRYNRLESPSVSYCLTQFSALMVKIFASKLKNTEEKAKPYRDKYYNSAIKWKNTLQSIYPDFTGTILKGSIFNSWLFPVYRCELMTSSLKMPTDDKRVPVLSGDYTHPLINDYKNEIRSVASEDTGRPSWRQMAEEKMVDKHKRVKSIPLLVNWGMRDYNLEEWIKAACLITISGIFECVVKPKPARSTDHRGVFAKKDKLPAMGLMGKSFEADRDTSCKICSQELFNSPVADYMDFPRPFREGKGPQGSGVLCKSVAGKVAYYSPENVKKSRYVSDNIVKKTDALGMVNLFTPIIPNLAITTHAAQGATIRKKMFTDFAKAKNGGRFLFSEDTMKCGLLVNLTRTDKSENTVVSNVDSISKLFIKDAQIESRTKEILVSFSGRYEAFR